LYGRSHPKVAASYIHAALLRSAQKDFGDAVRLTKLGVEIENSLAAGAFNGRRALLLLSAAEVFELASQTQDAESCYQTSIPVLEQELGADALPVVEARKRQARLVPK
jgi:hypothetical protein